VGAQVNRSEENRAIVFLICLALAAMGIMYFDAAGLVASAMEAM
jgi:hypothetical protein